MQKLKKQILKRSVLLGILMGLLMLLIVIPPLHRQLSLQSQESLTHLLKNRSLLANQTIFQMEEIARQITSRTMIRNQLIAYNDGEITLKQLGHFTRPLLQDALDKAEYALAVRRLDAKGQPVVEVGANLPLEAYPNGDRITLYGPFGPLEARRAVVSAPIHGPDGEVVGWDQVLFVLDPLKSVVADYTELFASGEVILVHKKPGGFEPFFAFRHNKAAPKLPALDQTTQTLDGWSYAAAELAAEHWWMIVRVPTSELDAIINSTVLRIALAALLLSLVAIPAAIWMISPLLGRLEKEFQIRHEAQEALKELNSNLERAIEEEIARRRQHEHLLIHQARLAQMGEMLGAIAHQWRQPLNALALTVQDVKDAKAYNELDDQYLEQTTAKAMRLINHMSKTIDDFRGFFRIDRQRQAFDPLLLMRESMEFFHGQFEASAIGHTLHAPTKTLSVTSYLTEFKQVLLNLIANARDAILEQNQQKATPSLKEITLTLQDRDDHIRLIVEDSGGGVPREIIDRIFDPYFSTKEEGKGVGLGLYMSKLIIEEHMHGRLLVENHEKGACFYFEIPKNPPPEDDSSQT